MRGVSLGMSGSRIAWIAVGLALAGCAGGRDVGLADRCADVASAATPHTSLDITRRRASVRDETGVAEIAGTQDGMPVVAECRFQREVLVSFRWREEPFASAMSGSSRPPP